MFRLCERAFLLFLLLRVLATLSYIKSFTFTFPSLWYAVPRVKPGFSPKADPEPDDAAGLPGRLGPSDHTLLLRSRTLQVTCGDRDFNHMGLRIYDIQCTFKLKG